MHAPAKKTRRRVASVLSARIGSHIRLEADADGTIAAWFEGHSVALGRFSASALDKAKALRTGLPLARFAADEETGLLVRRLARSGLLEYRLGQADGAADQVIIEPQTANYWPQISKLDAGEVVVLSRFAYLRRRGIEMVLESPRAGALFRLCDPDIAAALASLATPQRIAKLRRRQDFPGNELLALLMDCQILFKLDAAGGDGLRADEGDDNLVLWDFHDFLFHTRSTEGRQANPLGGLYPCAGLLPPPPAVRPRWPGKEIDLDRLVAAPRSPAAGLLHQRHSTRDYDDQHPITLAELSQFLDSTARIQSKWSSPLDPGDDGSPVVDFAARPYPSGGGAYALELYLAVADCAGLSRGFYHYDADRHALAPIEARPHELEALLASAQYAMGAAAPPQILITIAARFGRVSWKYSSVAYSLILKDVGVLTQTFYIMTTDMGLGGCAIGSINIDLFAKMTGLQFHAEGPVGHFAIGRGKEPEASTYG